MWAVPLPKLAEVSPVIVALKKIGYNILGEKKMLTPAKKKYIFSIYEIGLQKEVVRSVDIANMNGLSKASVCNMLAVLADDGLIEKNSGRSIILSDDGKALAETYYGIYNELYRFLMNTFKCSQISAREDALTCVCNFTDENTENMKKYFFGDTAR